MITKEFEVLNFSNTVLLKYYDNIICEIVNNKPIILNNCDDIIIFKEIKSFLLEYGFKADDKKQIFKDYGLNIDLMSFERALIIIEDNAFYDSEEHILILTLDYVKDLLGSLKKTYE